MKRSFLMPAALLLGAAVLAAFAPAKKAPMPLADAIAQHLVKAELVSLGGYTGDCSKLKLTNLTRKKLDIVVPAGTLLYPEDEGDQTLVVPEQQILALEKEDKHGYKLPGFCTEPNDRSPAEGGGFALGATTNETLAKVVAYINAHPKVLKDEYAVQSAIWAACSDKGVSSITAEDNPAIDDLRAAVCEITGKRNVWYNTRTNRRMLGDRVIVNEPMEVSGKIELTSDQPMSVQALVLNDKNEVVFAREGTKELRAGKAKFTFRLQVKGWAEGQYNVVYVNKADTVLKQGFAIEA